MFRSPRPVRSPRPAHRGTTSWSGTAFYGSATAVAAGLALATTSLVPAAASDKPAGAGARVATGCAGTAYVYGARADGTLTFTAIDAATNVRGRTLVGPKLPFGVRAMATLDYTTLLVTTPAGELYRIDVIGNTKKLTIDTPSKLASNSWTYDKLTADGFGHLFATSGTNGQLYRWNVTAKKPTGSQIATKTRIGAGFVLTSLTATGGGQLIGTTSGGKLMGYKAIGLNRFTSATLASSGYTGVDKLAGVGGGVFYARTTSSGALVGRKDANVADGSGSDIATIGTVDSSGWTQKVLSGAPKTVTCTTGGDLTYAALVTMFGSGWVGTQSVVEQGLPKLQAEMAKASITTPARKAAFLATLVSESAMRWDADQGGSYTYHGRGYIQITGDFNYGPAGTWLGVDLLSNPELARSLSYSAPIARWYWTIARTTTNTYADNHDMNGVNRNIGFAWSYEEATRRCDRFKSAYKYFTGALPANTICYPSRLPAPGSTDWYFHPERGDKS